MKCFENHLCAIQNKIFFIRIIVDQFNNAQPVHRHLVLFSQQQQQILQPPSLMYATSTHNFHQQYPGNMPIQQQQQQQQRFMFVQSRPCPPQSWILQSPQPPPPQPVTSMPTFIPASQTTFHHIQPLLSAPQLSFSSGTGIPQPSFSGGTAVSQSSFGGSAKTPQPSLGNGTGIPQPAFSGGTAVLKRKSHYLEESDFDLPVILSE
jgi:hypothetical protein